MLLWEPRVCSMCYKVKVRISTDTRLVELNEVLAYWIPQKGWEERMGSQKKNLVFLFSQGGCMFILLISVCAVLCADINKRKVYGAIVQVFWDIKNLWKIPKMTYFYNFYFISCQKFLYSFPHFLVCILTGGLWTYFQSEIVRHLKFLCGIFASFF